MSREDRMLPLLVGLATSAHAGPKVLIHCDPTHPAAPSICSQTNFSPTTRELISGGAEVEYSSAGELPDLDGYDVAFVAFNSHAVSTRELDTTWDFLAKGGRLVLVAEFMSYHGATLENLNELLDLLDVGARFTSAEIDCGCSHTTDSVKRHRLTKGVSKYQFACSTAIEGGVPLVTHTEGTLVAWDRPGRDGPPNGELVLLGDSNGLIAECSPTENGPLLRNFLHW